VAPTRPAAPPAARPAPVVRGQKPDEPRRLVMPTPEQLGIGINAAPKTLTMPTPEELGLPAR
jgi:hypothetical protein